MSLLKTYCMQGKYSQTVTLLITLQPLV